MFPENFYGHTPTNLIIGLAGAPGTGKTTVSKHLEKVYGFTVFEGSEHLKKTAAAEGIALITRQDYDEFHRQKQQIYGLTWLSDTALAIGAERLVFSGIRTRPNALKLRSVGGFIVALHCPPEQCIARMDPNNPKNVKTVKEYNQQLAQQESPTDEGAHSLWVVDNADYTLDTSLPEAVVMECTNVLVDWLTKSG